MTYRQTVEAIRYLPPKACGQVWRFLGWPWPDPAGHGTEDGNDYREPCDETTDMFIDGDQHVEAGDWIVRLPGGGFTVLTPDVFERQFDSLPSQSSRS